MQFICPITEWIEKTAQRGKAVGNKVIFRYVVAVDNYNWIIALQNKNSPQLVGQKFFSGMENLYKYLKMYSDDAWEVIQEINDLAAKQFNTDKLDISEENLQEMDDYYHINFNLHDDVKKRLTA